MQNPFSGARAALFDLDGTLIDTHIDFGLMRREMAALAERCGVPVAYPDQDILGMVESTRARLAAAAGADAADRFGRDAFARLQEIEVEQCANPVEIPGARELLLGLTERGARVGVVTRNCRLVSERLLKGAGLVCDVLLTRDDVPRTKPDPAHLLAALEALARAPVHETANRAITRAGAPCEAAVMVGDHWMDSAAGRAAGMRTIGLLRGRTASFYDPAPPDLVVEELSDLLPLVGQSPPAAASDPPATADRP